MTGRRKGESELGAIRKLQGRRLGRAGRKRLFIISMLTVPAVHFIVFWVWVNLDSILLVFQNNIGEWVGLTNIKWVFNGFTNNPYLDMTEAMRNTLIFFAWNFFVETPIAVVLAYIFFKKLPGRKFFTVCLYLPSIITTTVMVSVFKSAISVDGPISALWQTMGKIWTYPLTNEKTSMITLLVYQLWTGYGLNIILFHSAMKRIHREIFEAAAMDGITTFKELTHIILPLIWPTVSAMLIVSVAGIFGTQGPILLFTNGDYGTMTISHAMYLQYKEYGNVPRAAAIGLIFTVIGLPLVFFSRWCTNKIGGEYEY